jgi:hypothetical protein
MSRSATRRASRRSGSDCLPVAHPSDQKALAPGAGSVVDEVAVADAPDENRLGYAADVFAMQDWALPGRPPALVTSVIPDTSALSVCGSAYRAWSAGAGCVSAVVIGRLEVVIEGPVGKAYPEVAGGDIGEAEVDAQPYACVDNIRAQGPSAVVVTDGSRHRC